MKRLPILLILVFLILLLPAAASAAGPALQPVRTIPVATATTTPAPSPTIVRVATPSPPAFVTCTAPAICLSEEDAITKWGFYGFEKVSEQSCGTQPATRAGPVLRYCYVSVPSGPTELDKYKENGRFALDKSPAVPATTATTLVTVPATPPPKPTTLSAAGSPVQQPFAVATVPAVTATTPATAKPASIVDSIVSFFVSIFGGGKTSGSSSPPSGGEMEPTPELPGGMKPVTHTTPPKSQQPVDTTLVVTSPAAGERYYASAVIPVKWVKPNTPAGTVNLHLVSWDGNLQTEWASAVVPNTGAFDWHQQDLAHDCGVGDNPGCWGGLNPDTLGIKNPIQYQDAWRLPAYTNVTVKVSTDPIDPYPAYSGSSGTFTIVNSHAFVTTTLETSESFTVNGYPPQIQDGPAIATPWVGYRNTQNSPDPKIHHEIFRTIVIPDLSGFSLHDTIKKATLILKVRTDKGTGVGVGGSTYDVKTHCAVAQVWILEEKYPGYKQKSALPVIAGYDLPTTPGSNAKGSCDPVSGTVTVDMTDAVNQWFTKVSYHTIVLVGPDESGSDTVEYFYSHIEGVTFIVEKA